MASFTRFTACWGSSAHSNFTSSSGRPRTRWTRALGLLIIGASAVLASQEDELPQPTAFAEMRLPGLQGAPPQPTAAPPLIQTPDTNEGLLVDTRVRHWEEGTWKLRHPEEDELRKRDALTVTLEIPAPTASTTFTSSTTTPTSSASSSETAAPSALPTFFDGALSSNFTEASCPIFINDMIAAEAFQACYPISLLLQGSTSFFEAESSLVSISRVLDHACAANVTSCATYLATVASNLTEARNCGADYAAGNPTVVQAYTGLTAYQVVYSATCLRDTDASSGSDGSYCFGNAVTNTTDASQTYFYFLPLNASLPGATLPICGQCLRDTMSIYHVATANRQQPIANVYGQAATMVNTLCGTGFANATLADEVTTSGVGRGRPPSSLVMVGTAVVVGVVSWLV